MTIEGGAFHYKNVLIKNTKHVQYENIDKNFKGLDGTDNRPLCKNACENVL